MISKYIETSILAFIQGVAEFIPVSSSAHLIIISKVSNFNVSSLQLDKPPFRVAFSNYFLF